MVDIDKLVEDILSDAQKRGKKSFSSVLYRDEPILRTANKLVNYLPAEYSEMKRLSKRYSSFGEKEKLFYEQAKLMADFEDSFEYKGSYQRYFPSYDSMNDYELRGYFSWRTKVRRGEITETSLSFAYVYVYELINLVGAADAEDAYNKIYAFWCAYRKYDSRFDFYMKCWLMDFIVYYNLDKKYITGSFDNSFSDNLLLLKNPGDTDTPALFEAINNMSTVSLKNSRFYKTCPEDMTEVTCRVFRAMSSRYEKSRHYDLCSKLFGPISDVPYTPFSCAIFYDRKKENGDSYSYIINDINKYYCEKGEWRHEGFLGFSEKSQELGAMLKTIDCMLRKKMNYKFPTQPGKTTKTFLTVCEKTIDSYLEEKKRNAVPRIEIDLSKLGNIREDALITQNKLIVDENELIETDIEDNTCDDTPEVTEEPEKDNESGLPGGILTGTEISFLKAVDSGGDYVSVAKSAHLPVNIICDSINDKLYDEFGDNAILFDSDTPVVNEDCRDELKGIAVL